MNYFLGIDSATGKLAADFEEGATGISPGNNHPLIGGTVLQNNVWYHVAATYDGTILRLFLNGSPDGQLTVGQPPRSDSIQHFGIGTAMTSTGVAAGFFNGAMDEVRVWNYARSAPQLVSGKGREIPSASGLLGALGTAGLGASLAVAASFAGGDFGRAARRASCCSLACKVSTCRRADSVSSLRTGS